MRVVIAVVALALGLAGCASGRTGQQELSMAQASCKSQGYVEGSDDYAECVVLVLQQIGQADKAGTSSSGSQAGSVDSAGQPVYSPNECTGPIVMGVCNGQIVPQSAYHARCYGEMLNGVCTGPMF